MAPTLKIAVFWDVTPCILAVRYELSSVTLVIGLHEQFYITRTFRNWPPVYLKPKILILNVIFALFFVPSF